MNNSIEENISQSSCRVDRPNVTFSPESHSKFIKLLSLKDVGGIIQSQHDFEYFDGFPDNKEYLLSGSLKLLRVPNAGGSSLLSEVFSYELLGRHFGAKLHKTEMEIEYKTRNGPMTDYAVDINGTRLGVSVTRAMKFGGNYTEEHAHHLLNKKLKGVNQSTQNSFTTWTKQILHVWTTSDNITDIITKVYEHDIPPALKTNTLVLVTTTRSDFIFKNSYNLRRKKQ
ncbi:hypothetical protein SNE40_004753 [Patella caerulea]|uniref:Uncharacterized protein n=1 Tax=Patella caerulea TaxID=87958 RepID=A0AAN8KCM1_PATCE